jgi:rubrerythrin
MVAQLSLQDVLEKGIQKELESQRLYTDLSQRVKEAPVRSAFQSLVKQELGHQRLLESYLRGELKGGALGIKHPVDFKIAEHLNQPEVTSDMSLGDVFLLAAGRERAAHEFYLGLAEMHPSGEVKKLVEKLATQELKHKLRVEFLYTEVAFPQLDGG